MRKRTAILLLSVSCCATALLWGASVLAPSGEVEAKLQIESSIERRLETLLRKALNTEEIIVMVNVEMATETKREKVDREDVLPGVPVKFTSNSQAPLGTIMTMVRRVCATVLVDEAASKDDVQFVQKTAESLLGASLERGDTVLVQRMRFRKTPPPSTADFFKQPSGFLSALWLLLALGAIVAIYQGALKPFISVLREWAQARQAAAQAAEKKPETEAAEEEKAAAEPAPEDWAEARSDLPFAFLQARDMPALILLLQKARPLTAAVVIHYLPPNLASEALKTLAPEIRRKIVTFMSRVTQLDQSQVKAVEESIRSRINYLMGGEHKLAEILEHSSGDLQRELLEALASHDRTLGERLRRRLVLIEDLGLLSEAELKHLMRRVPLKSLAAVLKHHPEVKDCILPKVTSGVGEWLTQEIELTGQLPAEAVETEQRRVLGALSHLVREGRIDLHKDASNLPNDVGSIRPELRRSDVRDERKEQG
ncbi:MAG: hypothetical protein HY922_03430 [Elusimicrobia bacterium]|nr:hypothetical protein [Elusimicrobiota bacterium]